MVNAARIALLFAALLASKVCAADEVAVSPNDDPPQREIFVPFDDLHVILSADTERVFVTREEYEALAAKAAKAARPVEHEQPAAVLSADYTATIEENRARLVGTLAVAAPSEALAAVELDLSGVALRSATLDGKPAALGRNPAGQPVLFVSGAGRHELKLELLAPLETAAAQRTLSFQIPTPPATRIKLTVPGNVEIRSGATIIRRDVDERPATTFDLLPRPGRNSLVLSLNNHQLRTESVVVAHGVSIDEITSAYEQLHVTETMSVLHGAAEQFRFALPDGFEVTSVSGPQVARWSIATEKAQRILDVRLREPATDAVSLEIAAIRTPVALSDWRLPKLAALDVAAQAAVVGLLLESRLKPYELLPTGLIAIDAGVLGQALSANSRGGRPGAPAAVAVAAFYAPGGDYGLKARFAPPPPELRVTANVLLTLTESKLEARGGFALLNVTDKLLQFDFSAPSGWQVTELSLDGGTILAPEIYAAADGGTRIHVKLPQAMPLGQPANVLFRAVNTPSGWLDEWRDKRVEFPVFQVSGASRDGGAIAVQSRDDMQAGAERVSRLTPLDANEKSKYGLENVTTELAFRYDEPPYGLTLAVARVQPRLTARAFSFFRVEPDLLTAHYEIAYDATEARAPRLAFALPASTPAELTIRGLDGVVVKESSSAVKGNERQWTVQLGQSRRGEIRLAVDFQQPLGERGKQSSETPQPPEKTQPAGKAEDTAAPPPAEVTLPLVRSLNVAYQTGMVAVEGSSEADVQVNTALRKVDVGLLAEADYQTGRRLLGAFGYGGDNAEVKVAIARPPGYDLPTAIVERAELLTMVSTSGRSQTAARFQLRSKSQLFEVQLPEGSTLWSAYLDGKPTQPQREAGSLLIELPATAEARRRNLQLVYETPIDKLGMAGSFDLAAPKLLLRDKRSAAGAEVPLADLLWRLSTPDGFKVVRGNGTVFSGDIAARESPLTHVASAVWDAVGPLQSAREAAYRSYGSKHASPLVDSSESMRSGATAAAEPRRNMAPHSAPRKDGGFRYAEKSKSSPLANPGATAGPKGDNEELTTDSLLPEAQTPDVVDMPPAATTFPSPAPASPQPQPKEPADYQLGEPEVPDAKRSLWALEGVRSLPIDFQPEQIQTTFQSLGESPRLSVTMVDRTRLGLLGWCVGLLVFLRGVTLTKQPSWRRFRFVATVLAVSFALPLVLPWTGLISPPCNMAFYAACWLIVFYLAAGIVKRIVRFGRRAIEQTAGAKTAAAALGLLVLLAHTTRAEDPPTPITVPPDAIIIPYDPAKQDPLKGIETPSAHAKPGGEKSGKHESQPFGGDKSQKLLVPYKKYLELQRAAHPDEIIKPAPPAEYALAGGRFTTRLDGGESLLIEGNFDVDLLVDHAVSVPLFLSGGVLSKAEVDGKQGVVATLKEVESPRREDEGAKQPALPRPAEAPLALIISGAGRRHVALAMRFPLKRQGGWQIAEGRLPTTPAAAIALDVAKAGTEVTFSGGVDRGNFETKRDNETIETALAADGSFRLQWRAKAGPAPVDQSLAARGAATLDVQEGGLRLVWRFDLEFRRGQRDSFTIDVPPGYLVEKVTGGNVRGWNLKEAGGLRKLDVTLLKAAQDVESFSVALSRRGAVGSGEMAQLTVPVLSVEGAAQQSGELTIRVSPLLELRTESVSGAARSDSGAPQSGANPDGDQSPLGLVPFQFYRFETTPFTINLSARPVAARVSAEFQTVLRISERQRGLESRIRLRVDHRPIYRLRIAVPEDLRLDRVTAPEPFEWVVGQEGKQRLLSLYFSAGRLQPFDIVLAGALGKQGEAISVAAPRLEIVDADDRKESIEQSGDIAVEVDPSLDVRAEKLAHCTAEPVERVNAWLNPAQQRLARLALRYRTPDYSAQLQLSPRKPLVHCDTFTKVRVIDRTVEETILLDFTIREGGIRSLSFLLPDSMRDARISAPMLRQKTVEPVAGGGAQVRVRIELQEEVMGSLRVLVKNDRLASGEKYTVPAPLVETGQTDHRYITLESAGRDEIVIDAREGVDPIGREQAEWRMLTALFGSGLTQAYLVRPDAAQPLLTLHAQDRATVETASARIGLAKTTLVVDANGAYRGAQLYRVDNSLEQFLEVQLPAGARLWTAHVAGEPVKPAAGKPTGTAGDTVRIPLIKTARGDADYEVLLKYGGQLGRLAAVDRVEFPLIHTVNIHVELSQVELYVPETYDWFNFGGTMRRVESEGDFAAGWLSYNSKQIALATQALRGDDPYARARAAQNLKDLQAESESLKQSAQKYRGNAGVEEELRKNAAVETGRDGEGKEQYVLSDADDAPANRARFNDLYKSQNNSRANDVVNSTGENFAQPAGQAPSAAFGDFRQGSFTAGTTPSQMPGQPAAPPLTIGGAMSGTTVNGGTLSLSSSTDQPEFRESGGGQASRSLQRYAGRLAQQANQPASPDYSENGASDFSRPTAGPRDSEAWRTKQDKETDRGPGEVSVTGEGGLPVSGNVGFRVPGSNTYTGATTLADGGALTVAKPAAPTVLASLDVDLHPRGVKYLFTTPRGEAEVTAQAVSDSLVGRLVRLGGLAVALLVLAAAARRWRSARSSATSP